MNETKSSFFESRREFLKGTAYTVAGATVAKGVFSTIVETPVFADEGEKIVAPVNLERYPDPENWDSYFELDGDDWKRGGVGRKGVKSKENPDG
ncbi:MAG TPA: twin-arginine translocation signal domain-containing protein, partial [Sulfurovum sp.]|nr:twin-arginine translocation signal domain-containing protein [Sulfurovum sp.]